MAKKKTVEERNKELAKEGKKLKLYALKYRMDSKKLTAKQINQMNQTIGSARFAYNYYLHEKKEFYKAIGETLNFYEFKKSFNQMKKEDAFNWLKTPDKFALENAMMDVNTAYKNFFEGRAKFPKFKKKHGAKQSYKTNMTNENIKFNVTEKWVQLPKLGQVVIHMDKKQQEKLLENGVKGTLTSATISRHGSGSFYVSLQFEEIVDLKKSTEIEDVLDEFIVGCDLGLKHFLITSTGEKIENPRAYQRMLKKLAKMQRRLSKMTIGSHNYHKQKKKVAKLHLHIKNMRHDFLHKVSRKLVDENQFIVL